MNFERARSREQKDIRRHEIMQAAVKLLQEQPYEKITMASIGRELSFTRANLYKYVSSKEEIFLWTITGEVKKWLKELESLFLPFKNPSRAEFVKLWSEHLYRHKQLIELFSLLYTIIEHNVTVERLADFKLTFFESFKPLFPLLEKILLPLKKEEIEQFVFMQLYYAIGLYPATRDYPQQREALKLAGLDYQIPDFVNQFSVYLEILLEGLEKRQSL